MEQRQISWRRNGDWGGQHTYHNKHCTSHGKNSIEWSFFSELTVTVIADNMQHINRRQVHQCHTACS